MIIFRTTHFCYALIITLGHNSLSLHTISLAKKRIQFISEIKLIIKYGKLCFIVCAYDIYIVSNTEMLSLIKDVAGS